MVPRYAEEAGQFTSWEAFVGALNVRLGSFAYNDPMETLIRLKQIGSMSTYKGEFEALSN